ncbi:DJ-1/PfpI family protein [Mesorhizobium sp. CO1-1-8]|uniref:DJ-1/PfpI family protein n=1 Tax=Mesorhizobium sp. CO1-1-8 TaxID=2876631 RepID=UPI001CD172F6|nr:DJ-1/PfpI family protein [Mesorhizobium sp. CO1-1-8]MBZ9772254.1 DJ-1/PfpI family protein [Mesorhizobium sp. CO1-1-8]
MSLPLQVGFLCYPALTQLDLMGPAHTFASISDVHLVWKKIEPIVSDTKLILTPTTTFADCPQLDVICIPGGYGSDKMVLDDEVLDFVRKQASGAKYVTSVCTGSLILGAAGLLRGYRATSHWVARDILEMFGAIPSKERVCVDRNRVTGGGVTAGIDFGLTLASMLFDRATAEGIQLRMEYDPAPPFDAGSPEKASAAVLAAARERFAPSQATRIESAKLAAARL